MKNKITLALPPAFSASPSAGKERSQRFESSMEEPQFKATILFTKTIAVDNKSTRKERNIRNFG